MFWKRYVLQSVEAGRAIGRRLPKASGEPPSSSSKDYRCRKNSMNLHPHPRLASKLVTTHAPAKGSRPIPSTSSLNVELQKEGGGWGKEIGSHLEQMDEAAGLFTVLAARAAVSWLLAAWLRRCLRGRCGAAWPGSCDLTGDENGKQLGNHLFRFHFSYLF
jgi:hypothetical protein